VCAEFSKDKNYMKLFGPHANPNHDVYIFVGMHLSLFKDKFSRFYDIDNPTKEAVAAIKSEWPGDRPVCKEFHLSGMYGAGWKTQYKNIILKEYDVKEDDIKKANEEYWSDLFYDVKEFADKLMYERQRNGYITDAFGMPTPVHWSKKKDNLNRFCQRSGHILLQRYIMYLNRLRKKHDIQIYPAIPDYHDGTFWFVKEGHEDQGMWAMDTALKRLNEVLQWDVQIKGDPEIGNNLADLVIED